MTIAEQKEVTLKACSVQLDTLVKSILDAFVERRIKELQIFADATGDKRRQSELSKKISVLRSADKHEFYQKIQKESEADLRRMMHQLGENIVLKLGNAEYFDFSGRLR